MTAHYSESPAEKQRTVENLSEARSPWQDSLARFRSNRGAVVSFFALCLILLFAGSGSLLAAWPIDQIDFAVMIDVPNLGAPSFSNGHYFGVDELGRDLFARTVQGTQISLAVGIVGASIAVVVGTVYGAVAGFVGGRVDALMMRLVDILLAIPYMFVLILMLVMFGRSIVILFVGIGLLAWLDMSRIVRGQTLSLKHKDYVEAARATGVSSAVIIRRHILPNLISIVIVYATLLVPGMILAESFISFLGLGVQEPQTSLGALISEGAKTMSYGMLWQLAFPLLFFISTLCSLYFIGDGLRDALDPKDR
ncbi:ABC transporter permease [Rhizobium sp. SSA_523]|uniref:ABC transporter permease n=1 Tax=Rhizobium sp. SSA_523 TaxID=2952477 RepID=UPI002090A9BD|nr:ABC transporter permease subunit [Rhizobium sp. SSA_523]MCO5732169.1 ABC transporter permease subunit [Rhizobium sp. SSA_523]WKC21416.1 ABC transporter permease subunit [Rhizobium sp. SSA_523]